MRPNVKDWISTHGDIRECSAYLQEMRAYCASQVIRAGLAAIAFLVAGLVALFFDLMIIGVVLLLIAVSFWQTSARHELLGNIVTALWPIALLINSRKPEQKNEERGDDRAVRARG